MILLELLLWGSIVLLMGWLYNRWLIPGSHGPIRWVGMDFVPYWVGVRAMLQGQNPYPPGTTSLIQATLQGGSVEAGGDQMMFVYPALVFLPLLPLTLLPLHWAVAVWTGSILVGILPMFGFLAIQWGGGKSWRVIVWALGLVIGGLPFLAIAATRGLYFSSLQASLSTPSYAC